MQSYCLGFCKDANTGKVLLIKKLNPDWQAGMLNGLGGKVEKGETHKDAMVREFEEECGIRVGGWRNFARIVDEKNGHCVWVFRAVADLTDAKTTTEEEVILVDPRNLPENVLDSVTWLVPMAFSKQKPDGRIVVTNGG